MDKRILYIDPDKCTGCKRCELYCSYRFEEAYNDNSRIRVVYFEDIALGIPSCCAECEVKACEEICPSEAIKTNENNVTEVSEDLCIGCKQCIFACPFGSASFDFEKGVAIKCNLCGDKDPECASHCPFDAIQYIELDEALMKKKREYYKRIFENI